MSQTDFNRDGDLFKCCDEPCGCFDEATAVAIERARVVGVLDAWCGPESRKRSWSSEPFKPFMCTLSDNGEHWSFEASTPDAARAAATKAIEAEEV